MSDELNVNKEKISQILHEDLRQRKVWRKFVPHRLTDEQKQRSFTSCQGFMQICQGNPNTLDCIATGDKAWAFQYDPETKRQGMQ
jgi:hypothetical protein